MRGDGIFRFKQFQVQQRGSAMKINTDGILLAAKAEAEAPVSVLDIGAGTGVIALVLAQRFPAAMLQALEINAQAAACAHDNFQNSPFADRLRLHAGDFQDFQPAKPFDLIVSNPPFFINSLRNPDPAKQTARHAGEEFFAALFDKAYQWLSTAGSFQLIVPLSIRDLALEKGWLAPWSITKELYIRSFPEGEAIRVVLSLSKQSQVYRQEDFVIYQEKGVYTPEYKALLQPFFLNF